MAAADAAADVWSEHLDMKSEIGETLIYPKEDLSDDTKRCLRRIFVNWILEAVGEYSPVHIRWPKLWAGARVPLWAKRQADPNICAYFNTTKGCTGADEAACQKQYKLSEPLMHRCVLCHGDHKYTDHVKNLAGQEVWTCTVYREFVDCGLPVNDTEAFFDAFRYDKTQLDAIADRYFLSPKDKARLSGKPWQNW